MKIIKKTHNKYPKNKEFLQYVLRFGCFGIKSLSSGNLTQEKIFIIQKFINSKLKQTLNGRPFKVWTRVFPNSTLTRLSSEARMGKGKGVVYAHCFFVKPGSILFELSGISKDQALKLLGFVRNKVPFKLVLVEKKI